MCTAGTSRRGKTTFYTNSTRLVEETYVYHLPQTHPAGTFWYHAHGHGSSSLQAGWMAGALIVHDKDHRRLPPDVVLLMTQVLIRRLHFFVAATGVSPVAVETHNAGPRNTHKRVDGRHRRARRHRRDD